MTECTKLAMALRSITQEKKSNYIKKSSSIVLYIKIEILEKENSVMFFMPNLIKYMANCRVIKVTSNSFLLNLQVWAMSNVVWAVA